MFVSNTIVVLFQHEINVCVVVDDFVLFCCLPNKANLINRRSLDKTNQNVIGASFQWPTYIPIGSWSFLSYCCSGIRTVGFCIFLLLAVWPHLTKATAKPSVLHPIITHSSRTVVLAQLVERSLKSPRFESSQWPNFYWTLIYCQLNWKDENKQKRGREIMFNLLVCEFEDFYELLFIFHVIGESNTQTNEF